MRLHTLLHRTAVALPAVSLLGVALPQAASAAFQAPEPLVAEAPMWRDENAFMRYPFLPVTIRGKAAMLQIDLENEGSLTLSTAGLTQLGVTLADTTTRLDSLGIGPVVERNVSVQLIPDAMPGPPDRPPVVGIAGVELINHYDVLYDFPKRRVRLYQGPKQTTTAGAAWLPPEIKLTDCGRRIPLPPGAGTFTGVEMQLDGHPVAGVLEIAPYQDKMNQAAVTAMGLTDSSSRIQPIPDGTLPPGYSHNGYVITKQVPDVHMTVGSHMFFTGPVQIFPVLDVEERGVVKPHTPVMLMSLSTIRDVVLFNSVSGGQVCLSKP